MEATYSEAMYVLKVNKNCQACRVRMMVTLGSTCGVYDIDYNADEGMVKFRGVVDPNLLLKAFAGSGPHAECIGFKLKHPKMYAYNDNSYDPYYHGDGYGQGYLNGSFSPRPALPFNAGHSSYPYPYTSTPYYHQPRPYFSGSDLPPGRYIPSYASEYDPYADERYNLCSIM